jgi:hypothetical protein
LDIDESCSLDALFHQCCNFVETGCAKCISNWSGTEENVWPGCAWCIGWNRVIVTAERWTDLGKLNPPVPPGSGDALHLSDEPPPILDASGKEATVNDIETGIRILETKIDVIDLV